MNEAERYKNEAHILTEERDAAVAELERLRKELDLKDGLLNQAAGELDRLRELLGLTDSKYTLILRDRLDHYQRAEARIAELEAEVERLREDGLKVERLLDKANGEITRLRAEVAGLNAAIAASDIARRALEGSSDE